MIQQKIFTQKFKCQIKTVKIMCQSVRSFQFCNKKNFTGRGVSGWIEEGDSLTILCHAALITPSVKIYVLSGRYTRTQICGKILTGPAIAAASCGCAVGALASQQKSARVHNCISSGYLTCRNCQKYTHRNQYF